MARKESKKPFKPKEFYWVVMDPRHRPLYYTISYSKKWSIDKVGSPWKRNYWKGLKADGYYTKKIKIIEA